MRLLNRVSGCTLLIAAVVGTGCAGHRPVRTQPAPVAATPPATPAVSSAPALDLASLPCPGSKKAAAVVALPPEVQAAFTAYDQGDFAGALTLFLAADRPGVLDGQGLYRLGFCLQTVRRDEALARAVYERSLALLSARVESGQAGLEDRFYQVNVLQNLKRDTDMKAAARAAVESIEACRTPVAADADSSYRVARLYEEAGRPDRHAAWLRRTVSDYSASPAGASTYASRAANELATIEIASGSWAGAVLALEWTQAAQPANPDLRFQLMIARLGAGDFDAALRDLEALRPSAGDRADDLAYIEGMIKKSRRMTSAGHPLPLKEPDGRVPATLLPDELPARIKEAAEASSPLLDGPGEESDSTIVERGSQKLKVRLPAPALLERIDAAQGRLVALSMEVVRRGMSLQETAFTTGIAPLVLRDWREIWIQRRRQEWEAADAKIEPN